MDNKPFVTPSDIITGPVDWPKDRRSWEKMAAGNDVIFEDKHVIVFHDPVDEEHETARLNGEVRATLLCKSDHIHSLMDLSVQDEVLNAQILHGIQQAAYAVGLEKKGFEVRAHVYPPLQHRPVLAFKIRSGKPPKKHDPGAG